MKKKIVFCHVVSLSIGTIILRDQSISAYSDVLRRIGIDTPNLPSIDATSRRNSPEAGFRDFRRQPVAEA